MSNIVFIGSVEGDSLLVDGESPYGRIKHSFRLYRDSSRTTVAGVGRISGEPSVLKRAAAGKEATLRLSSGAVVRVFLQRKAVDKGFVGVTIDGPIPGYDS